MKTKSMNRGLAVVLAFLLMVMAIPLTPFAMKASAAGTTHTLISSDLPNIQDKGVVKDGDTYAADNGYFTVYCGKDARFDSSSKAFDDGFAGTQRINFNSGIDVSADPKNAVGFTTGGAATIKVWWAKGDADRQVVIMDSTGKQVDITNATAEKNATVISTLKVSAAGKYLLGNTPKSNYIFKIEVTEEAAAAAQDFVFDVSADFTAAAPAGTWTDGQAVKIGTDNFFTIYMSEKARVDDNSKTFDDGFVGSKRLNLNATTDMSVPKNAIGFTTGSEATVKVWWASGGADRQISILDASGNVVAATSGTWTQNSPYMATLQIPAAGTYYLANAQGNNYIFKVSVTTGAAAAAPRAEWSKVAAPVIASAAQEAGTDNIKVTVNAVVGNDGGDAVKVTMLDKDGKEIETKQSLAEKASHELTFGASASGTYTFKANLVRDGETDKASSNTNANFTLTLKTPTISGATSKGDGKMEIVWSAVPEAASYDVYRDGAKVGSSNTTTYNDSGLTVGSKYTYSVAAVRGSESGAKSAEKTATATKEAQSSWGYTIYGVSTSTTDGSNGVSGDANEGSVTVFSENGRGKIVTGGADGITFYYTAVPSNQNFTFRAKMHVDGWKYSNGQEAMGMMASDSIPEFGRSNYWTNVYYLSLGTVAYNWDTEYNEIDNTGLGTKYDMRLGLGVVPKVGITPENHDKVGIDADITKVVDPGKQYTLETSAAEKKLDAGRYNLAAGVSNPDAAPTAIAEISDFDIEIQKNNTGYFFTYYDAKGNVVGKQKFYDPNALSALDKDNVYVGFFAARNARATFTDIKLTLTDPAKDAPAEEKPADTTRARLTIKGANVANSTTYNAEVSATVDGTLDIAIGGKTVASNVAITARTNTLIPVTLPASGNNVLTYTFKPASGAAAVTAKATVNYDTYLANQKNLYVAPNGTKFGNGTSAHPLDVQTAMNIAQPGQTIVVMEGTYKLASTALVPRGNNGTKDKMIYMIADPNAKTRPVFDGQKNVSIVMQIAGDYWYLKGFDVANSKDKTNGLKMAGNNCVADSINVYDNGGTGLAIQAYRNSDDPKNLWPQNNLILNCNAYNNWDNGYEDADGFSAKLTVGEGNVFDGCVAYNNCDDGWDLYARSSSGNIGAVTLKNCVAYNNGYLLDGTVAGNGNGFKLGGENLPGGHKIINSVAFNNKAAGITSNSCPDVKVENCTSYNNEGANITLYTNVAASSTDFEVKGLISFKDSTIKSGLSTADSIKPQGTQDTSKYTGDSNYYWSGTESANGKNAKVSADAFKSLTFKGSVARNADGSINLEGFTELTDKAPAGSGAVVKSAASQNVTVTDDSDVPNPRTGFVPFAVVAIVLAAAGVAVCIFKRKRA